MACERRIAFISDIPTLAISDIAIKLANYLVKRKAIPQNSTDDALHIAIAATQGVDYFLTWNFKHINNVKTKTRIIECVEYFGYKCPQLCSPEELGDTVYD